MVARACLNVTTHVQCVSCYLSYSEPFNMFLISMLTYVSFTCRICLNNLATDSSLVLSCSMFMESDNISHWYEIITRSVSCDKTQVPDRGERIKWNRLDAKF